MSDRAGLSEGFIYTPKPPAAPAANIRVSVPPHNKDVFNRGNETVSFNIPAGKRGQYLNTRMSYLKFELEVRLDRPKDTGEVTLTAMAGNEGYLESATVTTEDLEAKASHVLALDGGAHALFNSLEVYHGTNLLEQIREYNTLYQLMLDTSTNSNDGVGHYSVSDGMLGIASGEHRRQGALVTPVATRHINREPEVESGKFYGNTGEEVKHPYVYREHTSLLHNTTNLYGASAVSAHIHGRAHNSKASESVSMTHDYGGIIYNDTVTYTFCIPLMSGILGPQMGKYIPVGALAADLKLDLGIAPFEQAFVSLGGVAAVSSANAKADAAMVDGIRARHAMAKVPVDKNQHFALKNLELELEYIEVASDVQSAIESATGGQYITSFDSFSNFQNSIPADAGSLAQLIGAKFSSVKTVLTMFRDAALINRTTRRGVTSRNNPFSIRPNRPEMAETGGGALTSGPYTSGCGWYYSVGATHYPPKPIQSDQEAYYEALKSQHMVTGTPIGSIDYNNWTISGRSDYKATPDAESSTYFDAAQESGTFFTAQNFESQSHKSALAESGINTLSQNMYLHCRFPQKKDVFTNAYKAKSAHEKAADKSYTLIPSISAISDYLSTANKHGEWDATTPVSWQQQNAQMQVDHFIHYDGILVISNGICNTRF